MEEETVAFHEIQGNQIEGINENHAPHKSFALRQLHPPCLSPMLVQAMREVPGSGL